MTSTVSVEQIVGWRSGLGALHARIGPRFARPEARAGAGRVLAALLGRGERTNGWPLAEAMGEATPDGVQRRLTGIREDRQLARQMIENDDLASRARQPLRSAPGMVRVAARVGRFGEPSLHHAA